MYFGCVCKNGCGIYIFDAFWKKFEMSVEIFVSLEYLTFWAVLTCDLKIHD